MRVLAMWSLIVLMAYVLPAQEKNDRTPYLAVDGTYGVWAYSRDLAAGPSLVLRDRHFISGSGIIHRISIRQGTNYGAGIGYRFFFRQVNARRINFFLTTSMRFIRMNMSEYYARWNWLTAPWSLPSESSSLSHSLGTGISFRLSRFVGWISANMHTATHSETRFTTFDPSQSPQQAMVSSHSQLRFGGRYNGGFFDLRTGLSILLR